MHNFKQDHYNGLVEIRTGLMTAYPILTSHICGIYMWDINVAKQFLKNGIVSLGILPEIHCWAGIIDTNEIVDLSTRHLVQQYEKTMRETWQAPAPPLYIWVNSDTIPDGVRYIPDMEAIHFALMTLVNRR